PPQPPAPTRGRAATASHGTNGAAERSGAPAKSSGRALRQIAQLETRIGRTEAKVAEVEAELADPAVLSDRERLAGAAERHRLLQEELTWLMEEWESLSETVGA
ncbi:MAG: hypothetical protein AVDCRST_MAG79-828, partial [uncultured Thermoleophilia bacterium]